MKRNLLKLIWIFTVHMHIKWFLRPWSLEKDRGSSRIIMPDSGKKSVLRKDSYWKNVDHIIPRGLCDCQDSNIVQHFLYLQYIFQQNYFQSKSPITSFSICIKVINAHSLVGFFLNQIGLQQNSAILPSPPFQQASHLCLLSICSDTHLHIYTMVSRL